MDTVRPRCARIDARPSLVWATSDVACMWGRGVGDAWEATGVCQGYAGWAFDSTLGYPGEGPMGVMTVVNVAGVHATTSQTARDVDVPEAGDGLINDFTSKLWELVCIFKANKTRAMVLADTHAYAEEAEIIADLIRDQGIHMAYTPATRDEETGTAVAGVMIWWDPKVIEIEPRDNTDTIYESRVMRVRGTIKEKDISIYGVYMPVRGQKKNEQEVNEAWGALQESIGNEHRAWYAAGGDFNAETKNRREEQGKTRCTESDRKLDELLEDSGMTALAEGSTHISGTQIDNWLMSEDAAREMGATTNMPGVCGKDHDIVTVEWLGETEKVGNTRPMGGKGRIFNLESKDTREAEKIEKYQERAEEMYVDNGGVVGVCGDEGNGMSRTRDGTRN